MAECSRPITRRKSASRCAGGLARSAGERAQIAAGHEVAARAAQHDDAQRGIGRDVGGGVDQRVHQREVERVERVGPVERQRRDGAIAFDEKWGGHGI